jgi:hypothetical protein
MPVMMSGVHLDAATMKMPRSYAGVIVATTTKNNHDTAVPFLNTGQALKGKVLAIYADAACYILAGTANTATVTSTNGLPMAAGETKVVVMDSTSGWLACVSVSGTTNLKVWDLTP